MNNDLTVHIGGSLNDIGQRFVHASQPGGTREPTEQNAERHVGFQTFELFARHHNPAAARIAAARSLAASVPWPWR